MAQTIHFDSPNGEQKLHLNLSEYAWGIIREDMHSFEQNPHLATFLNRVFLQYRSMASASISQACSEWKEAFQVGLTDEQMERLLACHKKRLLEVVEGYPSGPGVKFRLNNRNYEALFVDNCPEAAYYSRAGKYVKAVLEEYARQTALRREEIYFWQEISAIREHLKNHTRLLIYSWNGRTYEVKPYGVLSDNRSMYHYLVGLSKSQSYPGAEFKVTSYRISRILKIKDGPYRLTGRLTRGEQALVEKRLKAVGVQFLVGDPEHIAVRLTRTGLRMFHAQNHLRPIPIKVEGDVYHFDCAPKQIESYFFKFGGEAEILEPELLRSQFRERYLMAARCYSAKDTAEGI